MYAVIRAGGKQYRVTPGDIIRVEKLATDQPTFEFTDVLAVSGSEGEIARPSEARVVGQVIGAVKGDKILVFHYKRKKQYKKLRGHRQPYTAVRITEIAFDGQRATAPELPAETAKGPKAPEGGAAPEAAVRPKRKAKPSAGASGKAAGRTGGSAKSPGTSSKGGTARKPKK